MNSVPNAKRVKLRALQRRYCQLLAMLPNDLNDFDQLDADQRDAKLADVELIAGEMVAVNAARLAILDALVRRP